MRANVWVRRIVQSLLGAAGATVAVGEGSERYDASRHVAYATRRLSARRREPAEDEEAESSDVSPALWLQRETPKFPYVVAMSPADNPATVTRALLGTSECVIGSPDEATATTLDALVVPDAPLGSLIQRVAVQWKAFKTSLHGDVPAAFAPHRNNVAERLDTVRAALGELQADPENVSLGQTFVFYVRDFDGWDDATKTTWLAWIHEVTDAGVAHVVLPTTTAITPAAIGDLQRVHKVPGADFVAILLRAATRACDPSSAIEKLRVLSQRHGLDLDGLEEDDADDNDIIGYDTPAPPTEASLILETVGDWWRDLELICRALEIRGFQSLETADDRRVLVQQVCKEFERETMIHVLATLEVFHDDALGMVIDGESSDRVLSGLQAWKSLGVVTGVRDDAQILASPEKLLHKDTDKPALCVHPVDALLPFNQRTHGEAKFFDLVDRGLLFLRPKTNVEISVVPCDAKALVAPCWIETRPLVKRAIEKLWRDDAHFRKVLALERFEDNYKMTEEVALFEQEINARRKVLDEQTREFIMMQHTMKKHQVAQRKAELSLLELEIQSKLVYLERLRNLLD